MAAACFTFALAARADPVDIPALDRKDVAFDRYGVLYISMSDHILRYSTTDHAMLAPIPAPDADLLGIDVDPSGCNIAAADRFYSGDSNRVWLVNNGEIVAHKVELPRGDIEFGTWSVAWDGPDSVLVTGEAPGTGGGLLRHVQLPGGAPTTVLTTTEDSMVAASPSAGYAALSSFNSSRGAFRLVNVGTLAPVFSFETNWYLYEIAIAPDASVVVVPTYGGGSVFDRVGDSLVPRDGTLGVYATYWPLGVAFAPRTQAVAVTMASNEFPQNSGGVRIYADHSFASFVTIDPIYFSSPGNFAYKLGRAKFSRDGRWLAVTIPNAVRLYDVSALAADPSQVFDDGFESCQPIWYPIARPGPASAGAAARDG